MEVQKCVLLVYGWLKEHGLHKTCSALAEEYGSSVASETPLALTLNDILESVSALLQVYTNSSLSKLLTTLKAEPPDPNLKIKPGKTKTAARKPRKRKASVTHDTKTDTTPIVKTDTTPIVETDIPVAVVNDPCVSSSSSSLSNIQSVPELTEKKGIQKSAPVKKEKKVPKEKKLPLLPAGVWACPEMEETLTKVYERTMLSIDVNKVVDIPLIPEVIAILSDSKNEEESPDVDIESIEVTEPVLEPAAVPLVAKADGEMFTEDSDSDSDDELCKPADKNTGLVPPSTPVKTAQAEITKSSTPSSSSVLENHITSPENTEKKRKKKKKSIAAHLRNIENPITPLEIVGSDETSYIVKKKKKKNVEEISVFSEFTPLVPVSSTPETDGKKKKKIKDEVPVVPPMEAIVEVNEQPGEVKKKKKKKKSIGGAQDMVLNGPTTLDIVTNEPTAPETEIRTDAVVPETLFASETPPAKKKKKKIPVEENFTSSATDTSVTTTPSKANVPTDNQLALSTLGQSLKKKKKKSKNIGQ